MSLRRDAPPAPVPDVVIRPAGVSDVTSIADLYGRISAESFATRFMSGRGSASQLARLAGFDPRRGDVVLLAATATEPGALVGEARYAPQSDGVAEFAVVVDDRVQGRGIGRRLLGELIRVARDRGISRLSGTVRADNLPMLRLAQHLGCAYVQPCEYGVLELEVSAAAAMPGWPDDGRRHVLIESRSVYDSPLSARLRAEGATVRRCPGPPPTSGDGEDPGLRCPLVATGTCPLAEGADQIVHLFAPRSGYDAILAEHRRRWPERLRPS